MSKFSQMSHSGLLACLFVCIYVKFCWYLNGRTQPHRGKVGKSESFAISDFRFFPFNRAAFENVNKRRNLYSSYSVVFAHGEWLESCAQKRCKAYLFARSLLSIEKEKGAICNVQLISCPFHLSEQLLHSWGKCEEVVGRHFAAPSRTTGAEKCCRKKNKGDSRTTHLKTKMYVDRPQSQFNFVPQETQPSWIG